MSYKNDLNEILKHKQDWEKANSVGDFKVANATAQNAKKYYENLKKSGYEGLANTLSKSNYSQAQKVADKFTGTLGKTAFRPYIYNLAKNAGISEAEIAKDIQFDSLTGEVSLGGKKLGKPDAIYDGVSYWNSSDLDKYFKDYNDARPRSEEQLQSDAMNYAVSGNSKMQSQILDDKKKVQDAYYKLGDYAMASPYDTDEGRAIMNRYNLAGINARDNAIALGAASNGGNIDSSSAANAMRQQMALLGQGQQAVENMYGARIDKVNQILQGLSGYNKSTYDSQGESFDRAISYMNELFKNAETRKVNDDAIKSSEIDRQRAIADLTGNVPAHLLYSDLFNSDGTLKNVNIDYGTKIDEAKERLKTATTDAEKAQIWDEINGLQSAMNAKIALPEYSQWAHKYRYVEPTKTQGVKEWAQNVALENKAMDQGYDVAMHQINTESSDYRYGTDANVRMNDANNATDMALNNASNVSDMNDEITTTTDTKTSSGNNKTSSGNNKTSSGNNKTSSGNNKTTGQITGGDGTTGQKKSYSEKEKQFIEDFNKYMAEESKIPDFVAVKTSGDTIAVDSAAKEAFTHQVSISEKLSDDEKKALLKKANISGEIKMTVANDKHFK